MKKVLALVLIAGLLMVGAFSVVEELTEGSCDLENGEFSLDEDLGNGFGDPAPCGGGGGGDGSGDVPG